MKRLLTILGVCIACSSARGTDLKVQGYIDFTFYEGGAAHSERSSFDVDVRDCKWIMSVTHENSSNTTHRIGFDGEVVRAVSHFVAPPGAETVAAGSVLEGSIPYSLDGNKRIPLLWFAFCSGCSQTKDGSRFAPIFSGDRSGRVPDGVKEEAKIRLTQAGLPFRADFVDDAIFGTNENGAPKRLVQFPAGFTNAVYEILELGDSGVPRRINLKTMRLSSLTGTQLVALANYSVVVTNTLPTSAPINTVPEILGAAMIHDTRFRRTLGASARVSYKTDRWLTPDEVEGRDKYQRMKAAQEFKEGTSEHQR